jgi:hypothetical protein
MNVHQQVLEDGAQKKLSITFDVEAHVAGTRPAMTIGHRHSVIGGRRISHFFTPAALVTATIF